MTLTPQLAFDDERFEDLIETISERFSILPAYKTEFAKKIEDCLLQNNITIEDDDGVDWATNKLDALFEKAKAITPHLTKEEFQRLLDPSRMLIEEEKKAFVPLIPRIKKRFSSKKKEETHSVTLEQVAHTIEEKFAIVSFEIDSFITPATASLKESIKQIIKETISQGKTTNITAADYDYLLVLQAKKQLLVSKEREFANLAQDIHAFDDLHHTPPLKEAMMWPYKADIIAWKKKWLPSQRKIDANGRFLTPEAKQKNLDYYTSWKAICGDAPWLDSAVWESTPQEQSIINTLIPSLDQKKIQVLSDIFSEQTEATKMSVAFLLQALSWDISPQWIEHAVKHASASQREIMQQLVAESKGNLLRWVAFLFDRDPVDGKLLIKDTTQIYRLASNISGSLNREREQRCKYVGDLGQKLARSHCFVWNQYTDGAPMRELMDAAEKLAPSKKPVFRNQAKRKSFTDECSLKFWFEKQKIVSAFLWAKEVWTSSSYYSSLHNGDYYYIDLGKGALKYGSWKADVCILIEHSSG